MKKKTTQGVKNTDFVKTDYVFKKTTLANKFDREELQNEWGYMQIVVANLEKPFALLKTTIEHSFLPALFQSDGEQVESVNVV